MPANGRGTDGRPRTTSSLTVSPQKAHDATVTAFDTIKSTAPPSSNMIIVDWDGPDDIENPKNWPPRRKWAATIVVSGFTFIATVSSSMVAPAALQMAPDLGATNDVLIAMMVSVFVLGFAFGPFVLAPLSEVYGRSPITQLASLFYLVWNLSCAFAETDTQFIVFRLFAGIGGSSALTIGAAVLGDIWRPEQRGKAMAVYAVTPLLGPVIAPVCGAWIAEKSSWRWIFWSTSMLAACIQVFGFFSLQETYPPVLLERKAKKIREALDQEKGIPSQVRTVFDVDYNRSLSYILTKCLTRPFILFAREPIVQLFGIYMAFIYGLFYLFLTNLPPIFQGTYHEKPGIAGLHFLALGLGLLLATQVIARYMDPIYIRLKEQNGGVREPEFRLPLMVPGTIILPIGLLMAGWGAQERLHWIVVDIGTALIGVSMILVFQTMQIYIVDAFTLHAASAIAAVAFLRSIAGFGFPLFAPSMFHKLGYGKGATVLAIVSIALGCPAPFLFWRYGKQIRMSSKYARKG